MDATISVGGHERFAGGEEDVRPIGGCELHDRVEGAVSPTRANRHERRRMRDEVALVDVSVAVGIRAGELLVGLDEDVSAVGRDALHVGESVGDLETAV
jgi:hypothetical protein